MQPTPLLATELVGGSKKSLASSKREAGSHLRRETMIRNSG